MKDKFIRVSSESHKALRLEAIAQSMKKGRVITIGTIIDNLTRKLKRKGESHGTARGRKI